MAPNHQDRGLRLHPPLHDRRIDCKTEHRLSSLHLSFHLVDPQPFVVVSCPFGGLLVGVIFSIRQKISFWRFADTLTPSLILGQAIGRIGCFLNGDAHGNPTRSPWGLIYSPDSPAGHMFPGEALHPTQLYEMIFNFLIFFILWKVRKSMKVDGHLFLLYVVLYSAIRVFVEHFRADQLTVFGNVSAAQIMGVMGIILGFFLMPILKRKKFLKRAL